MAWSPDLLVEPENMVAIHPNELITLVPVLSPVVFATAVIVTVRVVIFAAVVTVILCVG
jgi:hypothetical protein